MQDEWLRACALSEMDDLTPIEVQIAGVDVLLVRVGEEVHAMPVHCPHMDESLAGGLFENESVTCLKHLWQWNIQTGEPIANAEMPLKKFPTRVDLGNVYVNAKSSTN